MHNIKNNIIRDKMNILIKEVNEKYPKNILLRFYKNYFESIFKKTKKTNLEVNKGEKVLSEKALSKKQIENLRLRTLAKPYMDNISLTFENKKHMVILADREGYILDIIGTKKKLSAKKLGIVEGACLSEECVGINGVGTSLKRGEAVLIYGNEHYNSKYKDLVSYGVPIKDIDGKVTAVLELAIPKNSLNTERFTLLLISASSIETALVQTIVNEAEERVKNISSVVATAVHDFKNPLSIIQALTQLGIKKTQSHQVKEYFDRINKQTKQLGNLLNNILLVSEPEDFLLLSPSEIVKRVIDDVYPLADTNNIKINFNNKNNVKVRLRKKAFARAMYNILINAIDCIEKNGYINVTIVDETKNILIKIEDNGPGISEDIRGNLFQAFISRREGGTGLGLYMVYQTITQVHQGEIWFETKNNVGTTFYIKIPYPDNCVM